MKTTLKERFDKLWIPEPTTGCWLWIGVIWRGKYGKFRVAGVSHYAHRVSKLIYDGYLIETTGTKQKLCWDHVCETKSCVNPKHLRLVSWRDNVLRNHKSAAGANIRKTHCPKGHPYSTENTYIFNGVRRACKICTLKRLRKSIF